MGLFSWLSGRDGHSQTNDDWETIGTQSYGQGRLDKVPQWVLKTYERTTTHHDGVVYRMNGKHYQYKVEESGQGACFVTFYRRRRMN